MREIQREIVSAIIFSKDGKMLMGRKDPKGGGVYTDCWHIPGGGIDDGESYEEAIIREVFEEAGIIVSLDQLDKLTVTGSGTSEKTLKETAEKVLCHMTFNYYEIHLDTVADEVSLVPNDDLVELKWFSRTELLEVNQIPGGREFFISQGYVDA